MIWKNAELHNVAQLTPSATGGYIMHRVPSSVGDQLSSEQGKRMSIASTGVEIRFRVRSGAARVTLALGQDSDADTSCEAHVFYGGICAGWDRYKQVISSKGTVLELPAPDEPEMLERIHRENNIPFAHDLVRLILPSSGFRIFDIEGDIEPPSENDLPKLKLLTYGSSITHGSTAVINCNTWAARLAENIGADLQNLGFAGSARMEKVMADHIATLDFDIATIEMGINVVGCYTQEEFYERSKYFLETVARSHPKSRIFAIDIFYCGGDMKGKPKVGLFRETVRKITEELGLENIRHISGTSLLTGSHGLSGDLTHPNPRGVEEIARNLTRLILPAL